MAIKVLFASQKGGVGKSALARSVAVAFAEAGWSVLIADFDTDQLTCVTWAAERVKNEIEPDVEVQSFKSLKRLEKVEERYDLIVMDPPGFADRSTDDLAHAADVIVLPTGVSLDDLRPTVMLADQLAEGGIKRRYIALVLSRTGRSDRQEIDARAFLRPFGYTVLEPTWPQRDGYVPLYGQGKAGRESSNPALYEAALALDSAIIDFIASRRRFPKHLERPV